MDRAPLANDFAYGCLLGKSNEPHSAVVLPVEPDQPGRIGRGLPIADSLLKDHRDGSAIAVDRRLRQIVTLIQIRLDRLRGDVVERNLAKYWQELPHRRPA